MRLLGPAIVLIFRAVGRSENPGVPVLQGGHNKSPLVELGLNYQWSDHPWYFWILPVCKFFRSCLLIRKTRICNRGARMDFYQYSSPENSTNEIRVYSTEKHYGLENRWQHPWNFKRILGKSWFIATNKTCYGESVKLITCYYSWHVITKYQSMQETLAKRLHIWKDVLRIIKNCAKDQ